MNGTAALGCNPCWCISTVSAPPTGHRSVDGRFEHVRGSALGFRNVVDYVARASIVAGAPFAATWRASEMRDTLPDQVKGRTRVASWSAASEHGGAIRRRRVWMAGLVLGLTVVRGQNWCFKLGHVVNPAGKPGVPLSRCG